MTSPAKTQQLVILGDSAFAEIAYEYFTCDSAYEVVGFSVEKAYLSRDRLFGLPVIPFEDLQTAFSPAETAFHAAVVYTQLNRLRARLAAEAKAKGFRPASYVSSRAFVWRNVKLGEHCFIFEDNTVQPFVTIGDNAVLWSGNHIGHHSRIEDNCFISSHVVISGFCTIGANSFLGVNATIANNVSIGADNWLGPGVALTASTQPNLFFKGSAPEPARVTPRRYFKIPD